MMNDVCNFYFLSLSFSPPEPEPPNYRGPEPCKNGAATQHWFECMLMLMHGSVLQADMDSVIYLHIKPEEKKDQVRHIFTPGGEGGGLGFSFLIN